ncbi:MAG TPA: hypothetical protein VLG28_07920 [Acidimicrobiia bacterium]|nr:hypothetical protein [Acidimicrobiia bacterium]
MNRLIALIGLAVLVAGCSDSALMDDLGERSHGYVVGSTTTTVFVRVGDTVSAASGVGPVEGVRWYNEGIQGEETAPEPNLVIPGVWARGNAEGRFIQASPAEINVAVPGIQFPALVPQEAVWVTSQLVYDPASATLDPNTLAAFGLWSVSPYADDSGRLAVLRVGEARANASPTIRPTPDENGLTLAWSDGPYRYELLCYLRVDEDVCWQMAEVLAPLESVAPGPVLQSG